MEAIMGMLRKAALTISADAEASNGELGYQQRVDSAAECLVDYVYEALHEHGPGLGYGYGTVIEIGVYGALQRIVAAAMIAQYEYDKESWGEVIATFAAQIRKQHERKRKGAL
jgi:hypothetical protein